MPTIDATNPSKSHLLFAKYFILRLFDAICHPSNEALHSSLHQFIHKVHLALKFVLRKALDSFSARSGGKKKLLSIFIRESTAVDVSTAAKTIFNQKLYQTLWRFTARHYSSLTECLCSEWFPLLGRNWKLCGRWRTDSAALRFYEPASIGNPSTVCVVFDPWKILNRNW